MKVVWKDGQKADHWAEEMVVPTVEKMADVMAAHWAELWVDRSVAQKVEHSADK